MTQPSLSLASSSARTTTKFEAELLEMREQRDLARKNAADATEAAPPFAEGSREWLVRAWGFMISAFLIEALLWGMFFIFFYYQSLFCISLHSSYIPFLLLFCYFSFITTQDRLT
jgi:hypothetical protein